MQILILNSENFKKVKNKNTNFDFFVLIPNIDFFDNFKSVLASYEITLSELSQANYDVDIFLESVKNNPFLSLVF